MVCVFCLLPLFLLPLVNILPRLWDKLLVLVFRLIGREYKPALRDGPSCPYKPGANKPQPEAEPVLANGGGSSVNGSVESKKDS
ncbi:hypothetical protein CLOM_g24324 [Closterium sp. NIES-68]|nr:hypothetical protein CLOM_g24324 [Closterium sp. NIES-68]GJP75225.1 hypothetical protein CLOP_g5684 [Closterium sp. NIES-67]GJP83657.1 hypothetical protein CLOP_g13786 [Closterium sp. NIES-67]